MKIVECVGNHTIIANRLICDDFKLLDIDLNALQSFANTPEPERLAMAFGAGIFVMSAPYAALYAAKILKQALNRS